jgi:hypothetical protein
VLEATVAGEFTRTHETGTIVQMDSNHNCTQGERGVQGTQARTEVRRQSWQSIFDVSLFIDLRTKIALHKSKSSFNGLMLRCKI